MVDSFRPRKVHARGFTLAPGRRERVGGCAAAICRLQAPTAPEPGDLERPTAEEQKAIGGPPGRRQP